MSIHDLSRAGATVPRSRLRPLLRWLVAGAAAAIEFAWPWRCLACGAGALDDGVGPPWRDDPIGAANDELPLLCRSCASAIERRPPDDPRSPLEVTAPAISEAIVAARYQPPLDELVLQLKYGGVREAAAPLAALIAQRLEARPPARAFTRLVAIPMHPLKRFVRGIDHAAELADELSARIGVRRVAGLRRFRLTRAQGGARSLDERVAQVARAFRASPGSVRGHHVGLVDDVVTSGATAAACARSLLAAGASSVTLLAAAGNG